MSNRLAQEFRRRIDAAQNRLSLVPESTQELRTGPGGWLRKEILGHLLDSAANNHVRFAQAAASGHFEAPGYDQEGWVRLHDYAHLDWKLLLERWSDRNNTLSHLVSQLPESSLAAACRIGDSQPVTLAFLIEDYLDHMEHHLGQIGTP